ncbi:MAG: hypothetical protein Q7I93_07415 [Syntrophales bacterium]|nr:hypothetical protein [Syntrophales bacterium]
MTLPLPSYPFTLPSSRFPLTPMTDIVIKAENLGKKYVIGHQAERDGYPRRADADT